MFSSNKEDDVVVTASPYDHNSGSTNVYEEKKQATSCRDPLFAVLFYANIGIMIGLYTQYGFNPFAEKEEVAVQDDAAAEESINTEALVYSALASGGFAAVLSLCAFIILLNIPGVMIKTALIFNVAIAAAAAFFAFSQGQTVIAIICLIFFLLMCCYAYAVWSRIPFATANLITASTAVKTNCGVSIYGYVFTAIAFGWTLLWSIVVAGLQDQLYTCVEDANTGVTYCNNPNYGVLFPLFVSYFFTHQVLQVRR